MLIYDTYFSLSDFTQYDRLWIQSHHYKGPNFVPFYSCVIFHCLYVPHLLYPFICQWTFRLLSYPGYRKQGCNEHWGTCTFLNYDFLRVVGLLSHVVVLFLVFFKEPVLFFTVAVPIYIPTNNIYCL